MDRIVELVQQLEPEVAPPSVDAQARQRDALLRSMAPADDARTRPGRWRPRHKGWVVAIAGATAVAVVATLLVRGSSSPPRPPAAAPGTSAVLMAITKVLARTSDDVEEVQSRAPGVVQLSATSWVDLATGACRTDTSVNGQPSLTLFVEHGSAVFIDYGLRDWWTRATGGVTCEPLTPQAIERDVATGNYTLAGRVIIDGQQSLKLVAMTTSSGLHPLTKLTTLWVNAATYLPIQSTSVGHLTERTVFTWLPATSANTARFNVRVPAGFRQLCRAAERGCRQAGYP
jgi:hypothetical protein